VILLLVAFDLEGTLLDFELFSEVGKLIGKEELLSEITNKGLNGEISYIDSLWKRFKIIKGTSINPIKHLCSSLKLSEEVKETVFKLKKIGCIPVIISGGFNILADPVAKELDIDIAFSNSFLVNRGHIVGIKDPIITPELKADLFISLAERFGFDPCGCVAVGDGANDLPMMKAAGLSIAFRGKNCLKEKANIFIESKNLTEILPEITNYLAIRNSI
jgi:phosphoserine phosphatase